MVSDNSSLISSSRRLCNAVLGVAIGRLFDEVETVLGGGAGAFFLPVQKLRSVLVKNTKCYCTTVRYN